jgi:hypothetical protein
MEFCTIKRAGKAIDLDEWTRVVGSNAFLEAVPDRKAVNPFTQEELPVGGEGKAYYVEEGKRVGNISLEDGELLTTGVPIAACNVIADQLKAEVVSDERS